MTLLMIISTMLASVVVAQSGDEKEVAARVEKLRIAMIGADKAGLEELAHKDLTYGHSNALLENKKEFIEAFLDKTSVFTSINLSNQTIQVFSNTAIVRHRLTGDTNNNDVPGKVDLTILLVWLKENGSWKLLARQAAKMPIQ